MKDPVSLTIGIAIGFCLFVLFAGAIQREAKQNALENAAYIASTYSSKAAEAIRREMK